MKHEGRKKEFEPDDFPVLQEFIPAYLHQDFAEEYGSAAGAVKAFLAEASGDQVDDVKDEWRRLRKELAGRPFEQVQTAIRRLGAAWQPADETEWKGVDEILSGSQA
jgi:hypothetical protein